MARTSAWIAVAMLAIVGGVASGVAQIGSAGSVRDSGGPLREHSQSVTESSGPVRESSQLPLLVAPAPLSGIPVSAGSRSVYGSGSVRDGSAGAVSDINRFTDTQAVFFSIPVPEISVVHWDDLELSVRNIEPSEQEPGLTSAQEEDSAGASDTEGGAAPVLGDGASRDATAGEDHAEEPLQNDAAVAGLAEDAATPNASRADEGELLLRGEPAE